jgi:endonuclease G, mitochondrial
MLPLLKRSALSLAALLLAVSLPAAQGPAENPNVRFGLPAPAEAKASSREAYLIERPQYALSYNAKTKIPNRVCWRLKQDDIGSPARAAFLPDPALTERPGTAPLRAVTPGQTRAGPRRWH